ncbi:MAG: DUF1592 domain-containing protein [Kofleriaceae bacterium]
MEPPAVAERFPRLSHAQWESTVQDLFALPEPSGLASTFTPDPQLGRFDNNVARLGMSSGLWRDYQRASELLAERVVVDTALYTKLAPQGTATTATEFIPRFGLRAFRRPLTEAEIANYAALFATAPAVFPGHDPAKGGVRIVVQSMLQSPFFIYRSELSDKVGQGGMPLNGYEVASRLSYLMWNSMPDDALFAAAATGELDDPDGVRTHAMRLFEDPRAKAQFRRFHYQAFSIAEYADLDKNATQFPEWKRELGPMMQEEVLRFLSSVIENDGGIAEMLTSTKAFVNADLASIYGLTGTFGDDYKEVELDGTKRAGLLTRAGFLARNATLTEPDPIHRGVFVNMNVLCRLISAPPVIPEDLKPVGETNRERVTSITGPGTCGEGCHHTMINPIGFAFENFDAIGKYRAMDNGVAVDSAATYNFADGRAISYGNAIELSRSLAAAPETHRCYTSNVLEFTLGRSLLLSDRMIVNDLAARSLKEQLSIKELLMTVVSSTAFRVRKIEKRSEP